MNLEYEKKNYEKFYNELLLNSKYSNDCELVMVNSKNGNRIYYEIMNRFIKYYEITSLEFRLKPESGKYHREIDSNKCIDGDIIIYTPENKMEDINVTNMFIEFIKNHTKINIADNLNEITIWGEGEYPIGYIIY